MSRSGIGVARAALVGAVVVGLSGMVGCEPEKPLTPDEVKGILDKHHRRDITVTIPLSGTLERAKTDAPARNPYDKAKVTYECLQAGGFGTFTLSADEELESGIRNTYTFTPSDTLLAAKAEGSTPEKLSVKACTAEVAEVGSVVELTRDTRKVKAKMGSTGAGAWLECLSKDGGMALASIDARTICGGGQSEQASKLEATLVKGPEGWDVMKK